MSASRKTRKLGRGLSSLIDTPVAVTTATNAPPPNTDASPNAETKPTPTTDKQPPQQVISSDAVSLPTDGPSLALIPLDRISANPYQPRGDFDEDALAELAASIARSGVMQPIVVRITTPQTTDRNTPPTYELVAGERRWRAATKAGLAEIPALVRTLDDETSAEWAIVENVQRKDLNPIEKAEAYAALTQRFGLTQAQVAERVGVNRSTVANLIRLADLEPTLRALIAEGSLTTGHGKVLCGLAPGEPRIALGQRAAREGMSVRALEHEAEKLDNPNTLTSRDTAHNTAKPTIGRAPEIQSLERQLSDHLGTKVRLHTKGDGTRGTLSIDFYDLDHFDGLMSKMSFQPT